MKTSGSVDYPIQPVPFTAVHIHDGFWSPRIETNRTVTIPYAFRMCEETNRLSLFERAAAVRRGERHVDTTAPGFPFDDTDVYKVLEGAAYSLSVQPDAKLDAYLDMVIAKIAAAQEPDGYLYCTRTINPAQPHAWSGQERWSREKEGSHELYNLGHLYEAAVAHYQATGKRSLLEVAIKSADLLDRTFGPGKASTWPGHQIVEMGLVKLTRVTGDVRYLKLAKFFLDQRRPDGSRGVGEYNQSHLPVVEQSAAVGHAVRAVYMYAGMADVAALTGDKGYLGAIDRIWNNVLSSKYYVTGGIGARHEGEAFGGDFELPNRTAYNETCASIGNVYWNHRLFLLHGESKYIDVLEMTLYNSLLAGVSLDGTSFFYPNPLESHGDDGRSHWFGCACCPGNMTRFLASVSGYMYAQRENTIYVNLYAGSDAEVRLAGGGVKVSQATDYPWSGDVKVTVVPAAAGSTFSLALRVPGWARNLPVPSELYRYMDSNAEPVTLAINGRPTAFTIEGGYATVTRAWAAGDTVELHLPMPVRRVVADGRVEADRDRVALQRGPIIYCAEWADNETEGTLSMSLADEAVLSAERREKLLGGVTVITGTAMSSARAGDDSIVTRPVRFQAIPYSVWANRGMGEMSVFLARTPAVAVPIPRATLLTGASLTTSTHQHPRTGTRVDFIPNKGSTEYLEISFPKASTLTHVGIAWFDDGGRASARVPRAYRLFYKEGGEWKPLITAGALTISKDGSSAADFAAITTTGLRIELDLQAEYSGGIQSLHVR